jgi:hypothetical protein
MKRVELYLSQSQDHHGGTGRKNNKDNEKPQPHPIDSALKGIQKPSEDRVQPRRARTNLRCRFDIRDVNRIAGFVQDSRNLHLLPSAQCLCGDRSLLGDSRGAPKLPRCDADNPLEVKGKLALVPEADAERDIRQAELAICSQEVLGSFNAARDHILARRQPSGRLELSRKVIGAEMNDGSHLLERGTVFEIFHDVLDDRAELPVRKCPVRRGRQPVRARGMTNQLNAQHSGECLDHQRPADAARSQFGIHSQHRGAEFRRVQAIERWHHRPG